MGRSSLTRWKIQLFRMNLAWQVPVVEWSLNRRAVWLKEKRQVEGSTVAGKPRWRKSVEE